MRRWTFFSKAVCVWEGLLLAAAAFPGHAQTAAAAEPSVVRLGILSTIGEPSSTAVFADTIKALEKAWNARIVITYHDLDTLPEAVRAKRLDYFISNAGTYSHLQTLGLARQLATRKIQEADDPNFSMGGVFFVKSSSTAIRTFDDMRGKTAVAVAANAFGGYDVHLGEIKARGYDPERFFASTVFSGYPMQRVIREMRDGRAEVGMVRACLLEELIRTGLVGESEFRVIGAKDEPHLRCKTSTALYPDWVFAATTEASPEMSRKASAALFSMPETSRMYWSVASDFTRIDALFKDLKIGHYSYLREWTFKRLWQEYKLFVIAGVGLLFLIFWHAVVVTFEVRRKTAKLREAMREREAAQNEVLQTQERLQTLERASLAGMLSNMVAHELKQPLGAIANYADGIETFAGILQKGGSSQTECAQTARIIENAASQIVGQTQRASAVIERVRGYARKSGERKTVRIELSAVVAGAVRDFRLLSKKELPITENVAPNAFVQADAVEISLVVLNLFKNASEALQHTPHPHVDVTLEDRGNLWQLSVADNGPTVDIKQFEDLFSPRASTKASGLGVGLAISARIMEGCGGRLVMQKNTPYGLKAVMLFPKAKNGEGGAGR